MLAGIAGLTLGAILSQRLKKRFPRVDPLICATGLFISAPLLTGCTFTVTKNTTVTFVLLFFGQVALNLNWAIVADILLVRYMSFIRLTMLVYFVSVHIVFLSLYSYKTV